MRIVTQKIPTGYKQTELGLIPEDWDVKEFGELSTIRKEKYDSRKLGAHSFCVELEHIGQGSGNLIGYTETSIFSSLKNVFQKDDVLFGRLRAYLKKYWKANRDGIASSEIWPLVAKKGIIISEYIFQIVQTKSFIKSASEAYGTHMPRSDWSIVKRMHIPLPPTKTEQTSIATVLSDTDALIEHLEKLIAKRKAIKQGAMQELLTGKKRLLGFDGKWEVKKLGEIAKIKKGQLITEKMCSPENIPVIAGGKTPAYFHNKANRISKTITISASGANAGYVAFHSYPIFASDCSTIEEDKIYSIGFIFYYLQLIQDKIYKMQTGGAQPHIHPSDLQPIELIIPKKEEQTAIAQVLSEMDVEIEQLEKKLGKYKMIKQGMLQELLTGKIRLV